MERGDIDQMSFAFSMREGVETWDMTEEPPLRTINKVDELYDVSVVTRGAYPTTEVAVRSMEQHRDELRKQQTSDAWRIRVRRKMDLGLRTRRA
jgi:phage head maturation protease